MRRRRRREQGPDKGARRTGECRARRRHGGKEEKSRQRRDSGRGGDGTPWFARVAGARFAAVDDARVARKHRTHVAFVEHVGERQAFESGQRRPQTTHGFGQTVVQSDRLEENRDSVEAGELEHAERLGKLGQRLHRGDARRPQLKLAQTRACGRETKGRSRKLGVARDAQTREPRESRRRARHDREHALDARARKRRHGGGQVERVQRRSAQERRAQRRKTMESARPRCRGPRVEPGPARDRNGTGGHDEFADETLEPRVHKRFDRQRALGHFEVRQVRQTFGQSDERDGAAVATEAQARQPREPIGGDRREFLGQKSRPVARDRGRPLDVEVGECRRQRTALF